jgi:hypothetical protein
MPGGWVRAQPRPQRIPPGRDRAAAHSGLAFLCRMHRGDSLGGCLAPVPLGGHADGAGIGGVRRSGNEPGPVPVDGCRGALHADRNV